MAKVERYAVVSDTDPKKFHDKIEDFLKQKWHPQGGVSISLLVDGKTLIAQAMVYYSNCSHDYITEDRGKTVKCKWCGDSAY